MLLYIIRLKPFGKTEDNFINVYNELIIVFSFFSVLIMNNYGLPDLMMNIWGWILFILVISSLFITWYFTLPEMLRELKKTVTNCFTNKSANVENKNKRTKTGQTKDANKTKKSEWTAMKYDKSELN